MSVATSKPVASRPRLGLLGATTLALASCTSYPRIDSPPLSPPPDAQTLRGEGGAPLYFSLREPRGEPRGVIYFVLGPEIGSTETYPQLCASALDAGYVLASVHPRGSGYSAGLRGDIRSYDLVLDDLRQGWEELSRRFPRTPRFLFGHSAGGPLALEVATTSRSGPSGIILVNPAYKLRYAEGMGPTGRDYVVYALNFIFRRSALTVDMNHKPSAVRFPPDRAEAETMQQDPLVVRYFSLRYLSGQRKVMNRSPKNAAKVDTPVLLIQGHHDALVDPRGNDEILGAVATIDKHKHIAPEGGHGSSAVETSTHVIMDWLDLR